jgi:hypothetical protein
MRAHESNAAGHVRSEASEPGLCFKSARERLITTLAISTLTKFFPHNSSSH